jgi:hypothetical protein
MPPEVRQLLAVGIYGCSANAQEIRKLRGYAAAWIACHRPISPDTLVNLPRNPD